jgi:phage baseplate assembly protein W
MSHIAFPFRPGPLGRTETASDHAYIRSLIEQVLFTQPGERVMRPGFGGGAPALVFQPNGPDLASAAEIGIHASLNQTLGDLLEVTSVQVENDEAVLRIAVRFAVRGEAQAQVATFERKRG